MPDLLSFSHRLAIEKDFHAIYDLYMDEKSNRFLTYDPMEKKEFETIYNELLGTKTLYIAEIDNEVVASYRLIRKTNRESGTVYLGGFVVKNSLQSKGVGAKILSHIKDALRPQDIKRIELTVNIDNEGGIRFYKKHGFEVEGHIKNSYKLSSTGNYYDEYIMAFIFDK
jgi:RimJ/RimL family protein N-acetyltransferase